MDVRTVEQARKDIEDMAGLSPSAQRDMFRALAQGNQDASPDAAAVYREAAAGAAREADQELARGFVDRVAARDAVIGEPQ